MLGQFLIDALDDAGKDVVGQIGGDHGDVPAAGAAALGDERAPPVFGAQIALLDERGEGLAHRLTAHLIARGQFVLRFDALARPVPAREDRRAHLAGDALGFAPVSVHAHASFVSLLLYMFAAGRTRKNAKNAPRPCGRGARVSPSR